jgi:hypothetical protein
MGAVDIDVSSAVKGLFSGLDSLFTSDEERENARRLLSEIEQKPHLLQAEITLQEAKHRSVFVAGWRPCIGWVCAAGLGYQFLILPFAGLISAYLAPEAALPSLEVGQLMTLVLSLLGLGGLRTFEKKTGVS